MKDAIPRKGPRVLPTTWAILLASVFVLGAMVGESIHHSTDCQRPEHRPGAMERAHYHESAIDAATCPVEATEGAGRR